MSQNLCPTLRLRVLNRNLFAFLKDMKALSEIPFSKACNSKQGNAKYKEPIDWIAIKSGKRIYLLKVEEIDWVIAAVII